MMPPRTPHRDRYAEGERLRRPDARLAPIFALRAADRPFPHRERNLESGRLAEIDMAAVTGRRGPGPATYRPARACGSTARRRCCAAPCPRPSPALTAPAPPRR